LAFPSNYGERSPPSGGRATEWKRGYSVAIVERIELFPFEQIYSGWWKRMFSRMQKQPLRDRRTLSALDQRVT
jgi:hypothetical protein